MTLPAIVAPCNTGELSGAGVTVDACKGWYSGNLNGGSPTMIAEAQAAIQLLPGESGFSGTGLFGGNFDITSNSSGMLTLPTADALQPGVDVISFHNGAATGAGGLGGEGTGFFEVTVTGSPVTQLNLSVPGLSNAEVFVEGAATPTPEPGAWALMLVGIGGLGAAMRASRRRLMATA